ncbi:hypothetical protein M427DRAFT_368257 [Gonapodya prolifera JEL478]|uniref:CUE domain-containing protein n=1 Tax=Gonapodya prolifera (strain JEL478) TaxID=1344416 RepID=A0A139AAF8_GONPJ|nr:hypothetical protein M427DRAFT_368257 [Gonapodya prolifera JEL478]|eukprot:KXS13485.1 hypothetical protein M427DRAFT_368257 [Gonapodya prolifera JEL478]
MAALVQLRELFPHLDDQTLNEFLVINDNNVEATINFLLEGGAAEAGSAPAPVPAVQPPIPQLDPFANPAPVVAQPPAPIPPSLPQRIERAPNVASPADDALLAQQLQDEEYAMQLQIQEEEAARVAAAAYQARSREPRQSSPTEDPLANIGQQVMTFGSNVKRGAAALLDRVRGRVEETGSGGGSGGVPAMGGGRYESLPGGEDAPLDRSRPRQQQFEEDQWEQAHPQEQQQQARQQTQQGQRRGTTTGRGNDLIDL